MPRLTVTNLTASPTGIRDTSGLSSFKLDLGANAVKTVDLESVVLERLASQLTTLAGNSVISYTVANDPNKPDVAEALGVVGLAIKEYTKVVDTTDLTTAGTVQEVALTGFPTDVMLLGAAIELDTDFSGGAVASCTAAIGDTGGTTELVTAEDVFTSAGAGWKQTPGSISGDLQLETAYVPVCTVTTTSADVDQLTAGSMVIHIWYVTPTLFTA